MNTNERNKNAEDKNYLNTNFINFNTYGSNKDLANDIINTVNQKYQNDYSNSMKTINSNICKLTKRSIQISYYSESNLIKNKINQNIISDKDLEKPDMVTLSEKDFEIINLKNLKDSIPKGVHENKLLDNNDCEIKKTNLEDQTEDEILESNDDLDFEEFNHNNNIGFPTKNPIKIPQGDINKTESAMSNFQDSKKKSEEKIIEKGISSNYEYSQEENDNQNEENENESIDEEIDRVMKIKAPNYKKVNLQLDENLIDNSFNLSENNNHMIANRDININNYDDMSKFKSRNNNIIKDNIKKYHTNNVYSILKKNDGKTNLPKKINQGNCNSNISNISGHLLNFNRLDNFNKSMSNINIKANKSKNKISNDISTLTKVSKKDNKSIEHDFELKYSQILSNLINKENNNYSDYDEHKLACEIIKDYNHIFKADINIDFLNRMSYDTIKRQTKEHRLDELVDKTKVKKKENYISSIFNRLIFDANKRIEAKKKQQNNKEILNNDLFNKKYNENEWEMIYELRFKKFIEEKSRALKEAMEIKQIIEEEKQKNIVNQAKTKKLPQEKILNSVNRLYNEADRRKLNNEKIVNKFKESQTYSEIINENFISSNVRDAKIKNKNYRKNNNKETSKKYEFLPSDNEYSPDKHDNFKILKALKTIKKKESVDLDMTEDYFFDEKDLLCHNSNNNNNKLLHNICINNKKTIDKIGTLKSSFSRKIDTNKSIPNKQKNDNDNDEIYVNNLLEEHSKKIYEKQKSLNKFEKKLNSVINDESLNAKLIRRDLNRQKSKINNSSNMHSKNVVAKKKIIDLKNNIEKSKQDSLLQKNEFSNINPKYLSEKSVITNISQTNLSNSNVNTQITKSDYKKSLILNDSEAYKLVDELLRNDKSNQILKTNNSNNTKKLKS